MRLGILFDNRRNRPLEVAVQMALQQFNQADHTSGHTPAEARFSPAQLPEQAEIAGLSVQPDARIQPGYIRICTSLPPAEELAEEMALFQEEVEAAVVDS